MKALLTSGVSSISWVVKTHDETEKWSQSEH